MAHGASSQAGLTQPSSAGSLARTLGHTGTSVEDSERYSNLPFTKAALDFAGSEKLEKARRSFLVYFVVLLFIEFAGVEIQSATLAVVSAKVSRPWVVTLGFWLLFVYSFAVYYLAQRKELAAFTIKHVRSVNFFCALNRQELILELRKATGADYFQPGSGTIREHTDTTTIIEYDVKSIPSDALHKVAGFNVSDRTYKYVHSTEDWKYFTKTSPLLRPAVSFNYFVYVLPAHLGAALIGYKIGEQVSVALASVA